MSSRIEANRLVDHYPTRVATAAELTPLPRRDPVVWGDEPGPLTTDQVNSYDRDGFLSFEEIVSPTEGSELLAEAYRLADDPVLRKDERTIIEPAGNEVRSIFEVHKISERIAGIVADERLAGIAQQVLGGPVTVHQSRINLKPGFGGKEFDWHSDFETWHAEDGMPAMRAVSISLALTPNLVTNGPLMIVPGSHRVFVPCYGETPDKHYRSSLRRQQIGVPSADTVRTIVDENGITVVTGGIGSAVAFDSNCLHGSNSNITPDPRSNVFVVFNSADNALVEPYAATRPRPNFIADRNPEIV